MFKPKPKSAFTLIELLVVIAIIGILATVSIISLTNARAKSRDAKRAGDMKQIQTALELFFNDKNRYPTAEEWSTGQIYSTTSNATSTYMQIIPSAPTPNDGSCTSGQNSINYMPTADGSSYSISFCLGNTTGALTPGPKCLTPGGIVDVDCTPGGGISACSASTPGESTCSYAGENYPTITIGSQIWLAKNLNVGTMIGSRLADNTTSQNQTDNSVIEKYCYDYVQDGDAGQQSAGTTNCATYGGLYQWAEAVQYLNGASNSVDWSPVPSGNVQGVCPAGWHIPTQTEINTLNSYLTSDGYSGVEGTALKDLSWGTDNFNFAGLRAGARGPYAYPFYDQNTATYFWTSSVNGGNSLMWYLYPAVTTVNLQSDVRSNGYSVRCLRD